MLLATAFPAAPGPRTARTPLQGLQMIQQQLRHQLQGARQAKMPANEVNEVKETPTMHVSALLGATDWGTHMQSRTHGLFAPR